jgi:pseudaminic acid cytidylyltransferase
MLQAGDALYVFAVARFRSPIQRALRLGEDGRVEPFDRQYEYVRSQDLEPAYHDAGQFYWGRASAWLDGLDIHGNGAGIVLPDWRVVDIDTPEDWQRAELLFELLRRGG